MLGGLEHMFAWGPQGYADDRIADGVGWVSFDVTKVQCPVVVLHGDSDTIAHPAFAPHTAEIVPNATLRDVRGPRPLQHRAEDRADPQ